MRDPREYESHPVHESTMVRAPARRDRYTAIVTVVSSILAFLAWYVVPQIP